MEEAARQFVMAGIGNARREPRSRTDRGSARQTSDEPAAARTSKPGLSRADEAQGDESNFWIEP